MNFLTLLANLPGLLGLVVQLVQAVESAMPGTKGQDKLNAVKATLQTAANVTNAATPVVTTGWPVIEAFIGSTVAAFNAAGIFKKSAPAAQDAPQAANGA